MVDYVRLAGTHLTSGVAVVIFVLISESKLVRVSLPYFFIRHLFTHTLLTYTTDKHVTRKTPVKRLKGIGQH